MLNIEGAAITDDHAILAQRAAGSTGNYLIRFERAAFIHWLGNNTPPPAAEFFPVNLVSVSGVEAGLTGLAFSPVHRRLFFTAAVEDRNDPVQDGAVLGSFVGSFSWPAQQQPTAQQQPALENCERLKTCLQRVSWNQFAYCTKIRAGCKLWPLPTMIWALPIWLILASCCGSSERPTTLIVVSGNPTSAELILAVSRSCSGIFVICVWKIRRGTRYTSVRLALASDADSDSRVSANAEAACLPPI